MKVYDFMPEYAMVIPGGVILIEKNGGGTVGKQYAGELWTFVVWVHGHVVAKGDSMYIGMPADHEKAANTVNEWFEDGEL